MDEPYALEAERPPGLCAVLCDRIPSAAVVRAMTHNEEKMRWAVYGMHQPKMRPVAARSIILLN